MVDRYDAGLLNDFGGGNVEWWQDYLRAELERAHDFYADQIEAAERLAGAGVKALDGDTEQKLREALRFSASRSVISSADERRILSAIAETAGEAGGSANLPGDDVDAAYQAALDNLPAEFRGEIGRGELDHMVRAIVKAHDSQWERRAKAMAHHHQSALQASIDASKPAAPEGRQEPTPRNVVWFGFDENTGEFTGEYCSVKPADARGMRPYIPYTARPSEQAVTEAMVAAGIEYYAEGGCGGLADHERREVVEAIIEAALAAPAGWERVTEDDGAEYLNPSKGWLAKEVTEPAGEAEPRQFLPTEDGEFNGNTFSDEPVPFGWITQRAYDHAYTTSDPVQVTILRTESGPGLMPRVPLYTTPPDASAIRGCATEGCSNRATVHFERGEVGSDYCHSCYMRVQALAGAKP